MSVFADTPKDPAAAARARDLCRRFVAGDGPRFVQGTNSHAASIAGAVDVAGFIDDFTTATSFAGKPIVRTDEAPKDAIVASAVLGKVWTAKRRLDAAGLANVDYYALRKLGGLALQNPFFWTDFEAAFHADREAFEALHGALADQTSRDTLRDVVNFRRSSDIGWMSGYVDRQDQQYFEDFLALRPVGETFVDVGGFDGMTSEEFIRRCPDYARVHVFEPEAANMAKAKGRLAGRRDIVFHQMGLSDRAETLRFSADGSQSRLDSGGDLEISLDRLDAVVADPITFLKMDIEGAERGALAGAEGLIARDRPRIAVAAYHRADDLVRLPEQVLAMAPGYDLYLRHYTECRDETVLFFVPRSAA